MANNLHIDFSKFSSREELQNTICMLLAPNEQCGGMLSILDDGCGMDRKEVDEQSMISTPSSFIQVYVLSGDFCSVVRSLSEENGAGNDWTVRKWFEIVSASFFEHPGGLSCFIQT